MDDSSQLAVQLALQTLKERCQHFQDRINELEKENVTLRTKCIEVDDRKQHSETEIDILNRRIVELTEQKAQLKSNVMMVASENRELWSRLSKLMQVNKTLGSQLTKINDSLKQHNKVVHTTHSPLIRSKTFTQEEPYLKITPRTPVELHDKISLELEDISLKLISSFAKEKNELEMQCSQMTEIQNNDVNVTGTFGFTYLYDDVDDALFDFDNHISDLKQIKELLVQNKDHLLRGIDQLKAIEEPKPCKKCELRKKEDEEAQAQLEQKKSAQEDLEKEELNSLMKWGSMENDNIDRTPPRVMNTSSRTTRSMEIDKMCPMCSKTFSKEIPFSTFQNHVESHFTSEIDHNFELL